ncbi:nucleotidyltransferase [Myxococcota bacterium]|nr:nucleotidyltransferase [Myxococcota bacterium]
MAIQPKFRQFDEAIKLRRFDENAELREKRDRVLKRLREGIERRFPDRSTRPKFETFNQGSYEMGTGVKPVNGRDYDIDVGVRFDIEANQYDPVVVKRWVHEAVKEHTSDVQFRRPCITVFYKCAGETAYHVDLAVYGKDFWGSDMLAVGKEHSSADQRKWESSKPTELTKLIGDQYSGEDADQFRRVIRYLKRWKDVNFSAEGNAAPRGIALTACAYHWFEPSKTSSFWSSEPVQYNDLDAMTRLVKQTLAWFLWGGRLSVTLPVSPGNNLFEKMTDQQMAEFKGKLERLHDALIAAANCASTNEAKACRHLIGVLGSDFPA